jgi:hypothetical protein
MGGTPLTKQVAEKALAKLEARDETPKGAAHPIYAIYHEGRLVAKTGLRYSSNRDIPVPHIKNDLRVNAQFILDLARCPKNKRHWLQALGIIPQDDPGVAVDEGEARERLP